MNIKGDLELSGDMSVDDNLHISGDVEGFGNLNVSNVLRVNGDVEGNVTINASTIEVNGDMSGRGTINATTVKINGDVSEDVTINADIVIIDGDRAHSVNINADNVTIYGHDDLAAPEEDDGLDNVISGVFGGISRSREEIRSNTLNIVAGATSYKVKSDGGIRVDRNRVCTSGARNTEIKVSKDGREALIEIKDGDVDTFGTVVGGDVYVDGKLMQANVNGVTNLSDSDNPLVKEIYNISTGWHPTARF